MDPAPARPAGDDSCHRDHHRELASAHHNVTPTTSPRTGKVGIWQRSDDMPPENNARPPKTGDAPLGRSVPSPIAQEVARAVAAVLEGLASGLMGRIYSPRIKLLDIDQV